MTTPRKNTSTLRARAAIAAIFFLLGAGILAPPLLLSSSTSVEWMLLPAARASWLSQPGCRFGADGMWTCAPSDLRGRP